MLRKFASFLRWRLIPVRYITMLISLRWRSIFRDASPRMALTESLHSTGFAFGPLISEEHCLAIRSQFQARADAVQPKPSGHPFVNLFASDDLNVDSIVLRHLFSPEILDVVTDYFGGKPLLEGVQVMYSYPTHGQQRESQYWHLDYGDTKAFHCVVYLNDVLDAVDGPFVFVDKSDSNRIGRGAILRRIDDSQFLTELKNGVIRSFFGRAGSSVFVDPSACYHYGSRCKSPRLALFFTFSTWFPFAQPSQLISRNAAQIFDIARLARPDLSSSFLRTLLQIRTPT